MAIPLAKRGESIYDWGESLLNKTGRNSVE